MLTPQLISEKANTSLLKSTAGREQQFLMWLSLLGLISGSLSALVLLILIILTNQPILWIFIAICGAGLGLYLSTYWCSRRSNLVPLGSWLIMAGGELIVLLFMYLLGPSQPVSSTIFIPISLSLFLLPKWATLIFSLVGVANIFVIHLVVYQPIIQFDTADLKLIITLISWTCGLLLPTLIGMLLSHQLFQLKQVNQFAITQASELQTAFSNIEDKRQYGEEVGRRMASVTGELQAIANQQAGGSQQQVETVVKIIQSLAELLASAGAIEGKSQTINQTASEVLQLSLLVQQTTTTVQQTGQHGLAAVERTVETNQEVEKLYSVLTTGLTLLQERTDHIRRIVNSLREISDQTHLLALNAAIEAAGAGGEAGERFGVVAGEVRGLSDRSREASREAAEILGKVSASIVEVADTARQGQTQTEQALGVAQESGVVIHKLIEVVTSNAQEVARIEQAVWTMNMLTQEISLATSQQRSATSQSVQALQELGVVAEQSANGSQQVKQTSLSLEDLSHELVLTLAV